MKMDISNVIIGKRVFFRKCVCMMFVATVIITYMFSFDCNIVKADEWDDAVKYYSNYGNAAVFKATNKMNGNIYFCSAGNIVHISIQKYIVSIRHLRQEPSIGQLDTK